MSGLRDAVRSARGAVDDLIDVFSSGVSLTTSPATPLHGIDSSATPLQGMDPRQLDRAVARTARRDFQKTQNRWALIEKAHRVSQIMALPNTTVEKMKRDKSNRGNEKDEYEKAVLGWKLQEPYGDKVIDNRHEETNTAADCLTDAVSGKKESDSSENDDESCKQGARSNGNDAVANYHKTESTKKDDDFNEKDTASSENVAMHSTNVVESSANDADTESVPTHCSICLEMFDQDRVLKQLPCSHVFHVACLSDWLRNHKSCPLCRLQVIY